MIYASCEEDCVELRLPDASKVFVETFDELLDIMNEWNQTHLLMSSSIDFPDEYTDNKDIIALCNRISNMEPL